MKIKWLDKHTEDITSAWRFLPRPDLAPGSAQWVGAAQDHLSWVCPCGCGEVHIIPVCTGTKKDHAWLFDGNRERPTLIPSILIMTGCRWHGYLTAGEWSGSPGSAQSPAPTGPAPPVQNFTTEHFDY